MKDEIDGHLSNFYYYYNITCPRAAWYRRKICSPYFPVKTVYKGIRVNNKQKRTCEQIETFKINICYTCAHTSAVYFSRFVNVNFVKKKFKIGI